MRMKTTGALAAALGVALGVLLSAAATSTARAYWVPPFKGNDTGGIISYELVRRADARAMAIDHCAQYGKVVKLTGMQPVYGGYLSFACIWPRAGRADHALRVRY
ncbi:hypothetical protein [Bradyrhizobium prioriisuperbiae]|uniref:hypothetical protein n=1 Tax=Bradyrhizobium prioriisuperbiae TaxID=2854389 RepID=UPI0028E5FA85|nr:hypothetical protein [Bradyrhizobium prioritasuperba]